MAIYKLKIATQKRQYIIKPDNSIDEKKIEQEEKYNGKVLTVLLPSYLWKVISAAAGLDNRISNITIIEMVNVCLKQILEDIYPDISSETVSWFNCYYDEEEEPVEVSVN